MYEEFIPGSATTGGAGTSAKTTKSQGVCNGRVTAVILKYRGTAMPATGDVIVRTTGQDGGKPVLTLLTRTDKTAGGHFHPHVLKDDALGEDIAAEYVQPVIADQVEVVVAQADDGVIVDAWLQFASA